MRVVSQKVTNLNTFMCCIVLNCTPRWNGNIISQKTPFLELTERPSLRLSLRRASEQLMHFVSIIRAWNSSCIA